MHATHVLCTCSCEVLGGNCTRCTGPSAQPASSTQQEARFAKGEARTASVLLPVCNGDCRDLCAGSAFTVLRLCRDSCTIWRALPSCPAIGGSEANRCTASNALRLGGAATPNARHHIPCLQLGPACLKAQRHRSVCPHTPGRGTVASFAAHRSPARCRLAPRTGPVQVVGRRTAVGGADSVLCAVMGGPSLAYGPGP